MSSLPSVGVNGSQPKVMATRICPACKSRNVRRSHRKGVVEQLLLPLALRRPFRCEHCDQRYYGYLFSPRDPNPAPEAAEAAGPEASPAVETAVPRKRGAVAGLRCPQCAGANVHRSRRRALGDSLARLALIYRYRCHDCNAPVKAFLPVIWMRRMRGGRPRTR